MKCPKCGSENVLITNETNVETKHRGCIGWSLWLLLAFCTCFLTLIMPLITNSKTKSHNRTVCICQSCGNKWYV